MPTATALPRMVPGLSTAPVHHIAHHKVVDLEGGLFAMGSAYFDNATPHWVELSPFSLGNTAVIESQYRAVMGRPGNDKAPDDHPVTEVSWYDADRYLATLNKSKGTRLGLPTEAEWEFAARGRVVDIRKVMKVEGIELGDFVDFVDGRFENFVTAVALGERIFTDPTEDKFQQILRTSQPLYGWRVHETPSGRLDTTQAYFDQEKTAPADWGSANGYGLKGMTGGVWEWLGDWYAKNAYGDASNKDPIGPKEGKLKVLRGGSWYSDDPDNLRVAYRDRGYPGARSGIGGFRVAVR